MDVLRLHNSNFYAVVQLICIPIFLIYDTQKYIQLALNYQETFHSIGNKFLDDEDKNELVIPTCLVSSIVLITSLLCLHHSFVRLQQQKQLSDKLLLEPMITQTFQNESVKEHLIGKINSLLTRNKTELPSERTEEFIEFQDAQEMIAQGRGTTVKLARIHKNCNGSLIFAKQKSITIRGILKNRRRANLNLKGIIKKRDTTTRRKKFINKNMKKEQTIVQEHETSEGEIKCVRFRLPKAVRFRIEEK